MNLPAEEIIKAFAEHLYGVPETFSDPSLGFPVFGYKFNKDLVEENVDKLYLVTTNPTLNSSHAHVVAGMILMSCKASIPTIVKEVIIEHAVKDKDYVLGEKKRVEEFDQFFEALITY